MFNCNVIAIDLEKNLFQICKTDKSGKVIYNKAISRPKFKELLGRVDLCCTFCIQQYIGSHINMNASDNMLA